MSYFFAFSLPLIFSLLATPLIMRLAIKLQIIDRPGERKIHQKEIPLLGGLGIFFSFSLTLVILWFFGELVDPKVSLNLILIIWLAGLLVIFGGAMDDKFNLPAWKQILFPIIASLAVVFFGLSVQFVTNPIGGVIVVPAIFSGLIAFVWIMAMSYTTKLLDGLDGLVSGITVIASLLIFIVSLFWDTAFSVTSLLSLALAGSYLGFLVFNWHPAKIFLGEGGSVFAGFMLGILSILSGSKIATALLIMGIPMLDVALVVMQRLLRGKSAIKGDNYHLHFRLLQAGLSQRKAVVLLWSLSLIFGSLSLFLHTKGKIVAFCLLALVMAILAWKLLNTKTMANE
jgi:UDP-GlcNAc:undecaprenyl-phosphate GlcNAc-1-phosphate transferase